MIYEKIARCTRRERKRRGWKASLIIASWKTFAYISVVAVPSSKEISQATLQDLSYTSNIKYLREFFFQILPLG